MFHTVKQKSKNSIYQHFIQQTIPQMCPLKKWLLLTYFQQKKQFFSYLQNTDNTPKIQKSNLKQLISTRYSNIHQNHSYITHKMTFYFFQIPQPAQLNSQTKLQLSIINFQIMDIWSFKTQGVNYDKYRPQYPIELKSDAVEPLNNREKYLDLAVGTGKILLSFCQYFKNSKGIDVSDQMLGVSQEGVNHYLEGHPQTSIVLQKNNVMDLKDQQKYDLITVGQALHFFSSQKTYEKIKSMLNDNGIFMIFGYVLRQVHSQNPAQNSYFYQFYDNMLPYFTFDMYELHNHYTDEVRFPFNKVFDKIDRKQSDLVVTMTREQYMNYLKTWSAYNLYMTKHGVDPILDIESKSAQNVTCVFDYFRIRCYK